MQGDWYKSGDWNAICDICGFRFKASRLQKNWKGLMVCESDWEARHPQEFLRVRKEKISVPWTRPEGENQYTKVCWLWERTAYADLATADCAMADYTPISYEAALALRGPDEINVGLGSSAIPSYAISGYSIPGVTLGP